MGWKRGIRNVNAKLTPEKVRAIRRDTRPQRQIAAQHNIAQCVVSLIRAGKLWTHVPDGDPS